MSFARRLEIEQTIDRLMNLLDIMNHARGNEFSDAEIKDVERELACARHELKLFGGPVKRAANN